MKNKALLKLVQYKPVFNPYNSSDRLVFFFFATDTRFVGIKLNGKVLCRDLDISELHNGVFSFY